MTQFTIQQYVVDVFLVHPILQSVIVELPCRYHTNIHLENVVKTAGLENKAA
jgi:hypothetical protein